MPVVAKVKVYLVIGIPLAKILKKSLEKVTVTGWGVDPTYEWSIFGGRGFPSVCAPHGTWEKSYAGRIWCFSKALGQVKMGNGFHAILLGQNKTSWYDSMLHLISHSVLTIPNTKCRILDHWLLFSLLFEVRIGGHAGRHVRTIRSHVFPGLSLVWPRHTMPPTGNPCPFFPHSIRLCRTNRINPRVVNSKGTASNMSSDFCYPVERALCKRQAAKKMCLCCVCVCVMLFCRLYGVFSQYES